MRRLTPLIVCFLLAACVPANPVETGSSSSSSAASFAVPSAPSESILEKYPSRYSLDHFATMRLQGRDLTLEKVLEDNTAYTRHAITYYSNGVKISGIMNIPKGAGPFPLVILNHGHIDTSVYTQGRGLKREQDYLARAGFAVLHTDYRGHALSDPNPDKSDIYDASLGYSMDAANAINAVRAAKLPTVDASRVGMLGHSMGGGVTMNVAVAHPELLSAVVLYAPVHSDAWQNFLRWRDEGKQGEPTRAALQSREENPSAWDALSSRVYFDRIDDPVLLFLGTRDADVPAAWSNDLKEQLEAKKKNITFVGYAGEGHEFTQQWNDFMKRTAEFLQENLRPQADKTAAVSTILDLTRVTKKPFGIYVAPETSPVSPERFRGYHTGADFEIREGEDETTMNVPAICKGPVISSQYVNGYGGVLVQRCTINDEDATVLYGHMAQASLRAPGDQLQQGDVIGHLGRGFSSQTDNERPHLHLSVHKGKDATLAGYVQSQVLLEAWIDPLTVLP